MALASWLTLVAFSLAATDQLLEASSKEMFAAASRSILADVRTAYEPVEGATTVLAHSQLVKARTDGERLWSVPLLIETLRQFPAAAAIQVGYADGDYFIVRVLRSALSRRFEAPPGAAYEADNIDGASHRFRRWFYDEKLKLLEARELPASGYDPRTRPWYQAGMASPAAAATPPYVFFFMSEIGVTLARSSADRRAVVATDLTLASLSGTLAAQRVTPSTEALLQDSGGVIAWSGKAAPLVAQPDGTMRRRSMQELDHPAFAALAGGTAPKGWLVHRAKLSFGTDDSTELVVAIPQTELLAGLRERRTRLLAASFVLLALLVPLVWILATRISLPLRELHKAIGRVGEGDLDFRLPDIRSRDEVGNLNLALNSMQRSLKQHIEKLSAETAARERLESELDIARRIQMGLVPGGGQLSRSFGGTHLFARLLPARAVGGDLYEVIELPDSRLFVGVGDVSDKGIPAALFMSRAVTLAKTLVPSAGDPAELLSRLNRLLAVDNAQCMFITYFSAIIDLRSGHLRYACAGHNPPVHIGKDGARFLPVESGPPLGLFESAAYAESTCQLGNGEHIVIYTDGITEAFDADRREFSEERLLAVLDRMGRTSSADDLGTTLLREVSAFAGAAPQSDDITALVLGRA